MGGEGRALVAEFLRFHLVGAGTLLIGTLVFLALVALGVAPVWALVGDYAVGILFSYYMNKRVTFRVKVESDTRPLSLTVLTYALTFLANALLLTLAIERFGFNVVYSQIVIMLALAVLNYLAFKFLIFGRSGARRAVVNDAAGTG